RTPEPSIVSFTRRTVAAASRLVVALGQLLLERRAEPRHHPGAAEPRLQPSALGLHEGAGRATHLLEQANDDPPILRLRPAADHSPVGPYGRSGVAVPVEEAAAVRPEVPIAFLPPHRGGIEAGEQAGPRIRSFDRIRVVREDEPGGPVDVDAHGVDVDERLLRLRRGPS